MQNNLKKNKEENNKKEEKNNKKLTASFQHMTPKMPIKQPLSLETTKQITEKKMKFLPQLKFITHQEEDQIFNLDEIILIDLNPV